MSRSGAARRQKRFRQKLDKAGFALVSLWASKRYLDTADARAKPMNMGRHAVMRAALEYGLDRVPTSVIIAVEKRYRDVVGFPTAPHWPGAPFRADYREHIKSWLDVARAARKAKIAARKLRSAAQKKSRAKAA